MAAVCAWFGPSVKHSSAESEGQGSAKSSKVTAVPLEMSAALSLCSHTRQSKFF